MTPSEALLAVKFVGGVGLGVGVLAVVFNLFLLFILIRGKSI